MSRQWIQLVTGEQQTDRRFSSEFRVAFDSPTVPLLFYLARMPDPLFRQRLRNHHRDLAGIILELERGSPEWFDCERAMMATERLYVRLFKAAINPVHCQPAYREKP